MFFSKELILLGYATNFHTTKVLDMILVMGKMYIYRQKVNNKNLSVNTFVEEIKQRYLIETFNSALADTKDEHNAKWFLFLPLLDN